MPCMPGRQAASQPRPAGGLTAGPPGFQPGSHSSARQPAQLGTSQPAHQPAILVQPAAHSQPASHSHPASQPPTHNPHPHPASESATHSHPASDPQPATHTQPGRHPRHPASQPASHSQPPSLLACQPTTQSHSQQPTHSQAASHRQPQPASEPAYPSEPQPASLASLAVTASTMQPLNNSLKSTL